jgi:hypothetical protein
MLHTSANIKKKNSLQCKKIAKEVCWALEVNTAVGISCANTQHPLSAKVGTDFTEKRRSFGRTLCLWTKGKEFVFFVIWHLYRVMHFKK